MVGDWIGKVHIAGANGKQIEAVSRMKAELTLDGTYQKFQWDLDVPGKGKTTMVGYVTFDLKEKAYRSWVFDNSSSLPQQHKGQLKQSSFSMKSKPIEGPKGLSSFRFKFEPKPNKEMHVVVEVQQGEAWSNSIEGMLKRA